MRFAPPNISRAGKSDCRTRSRQNSYRQVLLVLPVSLSLVCAHAIAQQADQQVRLLAQNTTQGQSPTPTPRVISKPQTVTEDENTASTANDTRATSASTESTNTANDTVADILKLLPQQWRTKIEELTGSSTDGSNQDLVRKIALPAVGVLALILVLPFILGAVLKRIFRRRPAEVSILPSHDQRLAELDLDDLDFSAKGAQASPDTLSTAVAADEKASQAAPAESIAMATAAEQEQASSGQEALTTDSTMVLDDGYSEDSRTLTTHPIVDDTQAPEHYSPVTDTNIETPANDSIQAQVPVGVSHDLPDAHHTSEEEGIKTMTGIQATNNQEPTPPQPPPVVSTHQIEPDLPKPMTKFGLWLNQLPSDLGSRYSIEALLYWVSYGAGKAKPGLREELNNAAELDNHGRIKKAVLTARPEVLNDVLLSVRTNFSSAQQLQILDLMLAVLVTGDGIKPVENLILRFYCDYTGMGIETLERRYHEGFNAELPGIPRPDRLKWWDNQIASDVHQATNSSSMLGIEATASESQYKMALKLAEHRHDPSRFDLLGDKERSLVARNLQKYQAIVESKLETEA